MRATRLWQPTGRSKNGAPKDRFRILEFTNPVTGTQSWRVTGTKRDGTRVRENFADTQAAQARKVELETEWLGQKTETALRATKLSETQLRLAEVAFVKLDNEQELLPAVDYWLKHGRQQQVSESPRLDEAIGQFKTWLESCESLRPRTKRNLKLRATMFANSMPDVRLSTITPEFLESYLAKRGSVSGATKDNDKRALSRFFAWCIERPRRWLHSNPAREVKIDRGEKAPPAILSVEDCAALLRAAEKNRKGALAPYMALCLFAGLRPFEASRLTWQQINLKDAEIRLEANQTKTRRPRVVTIHPALKAWLKRYERKAIFPRNWRRQFDSVKERAGFKSGNSRGGRKSLLKGEGKPWPVDVMRHTAISHFFRQSGSYGLTAEQFGNSEAIIKAHYQGRVSTEDTKRFYAILPAKKGAKK